MAKKVIKRPKSKPAKRNVKRAVDREQLVVPKGFKRQRLIKAANAHLLVATSSTFMTQPKYICMPTGPAPAPCLRYGLDPQTGEYSIPPFGELMSCAACRASR